MVLKYIKCEKVNNKSNRFSEKYFWCSLFSQLPQLLSMTHLI